MYFMNNPLLHTIRGRPEISEINHSNGCFLNVRQITFSNISSNIKVAKSHLNRLELDAKNIQKIFNDFCRFFFLKNQLINFPKFES